MVQHPDVLVEIGLTAEPVEVDVESHPDYEVIFQQGSQVLVFSYRSEYFLVCVRYAPDNLPPALPVMCMCYDGETYYLRRRAKLSDLDDTGKLEEPFSKFAYDPNAMHILDAWARTDEKGKAVVEFIEPRVVDWAEDGVEQVRGMGGAMEIVRYIINRRNRQY
jgi:hypothetical protein